MSAKNRQQRNNKNGNTGKQNYNKFRTEDYVCHIAPLLHMESSSSSEVKNGVEWISKLVEDKESRREKVTSHQIRNVFSLIKGIRKEREPIKRLNTLRPMMAYIGARQKSAHGKLIVEIIDELVVKVSDAPEKYREEYLEGLEYIMESIVAYHKFHHGEK